MTRASKTPKAKTTAVTPASPASAQSIARAALYAQRQAQAVRMHAAGMSVPDIAVRLGVSDATAQGMLVNSNQAQTQAQPAYAQDPELRVTGPTHLPTTAAAAQKAKRKVLPPPNRPNHPRMMTAAQRRVRVLKLRVVGMSTRAIAERVGISQVRVCQIITEEMEKLNKQTDNQAHIVRRMEVQRCDELLLGLMPRRRDPRYTDSILRIMERRASYLGIDAPKRSEVAAEMKSISDKRDLSGLTDEQLATLDNLQAEMDKLLTICESPIDTTVINPLEDEGDDDEDA